MAHETDDSTLVEINGTLRWNEFEGGFWSLDIDASDGAFERWDGRVVLGDGPMPAESRDGCRVLVRGRAREEMLDFLMAGTRFDAQHVELLEAKR